MLLSSSGVVAVKMGTNWTLVLAFRVILYISFTFVRRPCFYLWISYGAIQIVLLLLFYYFILLIILILLILILLLLLLGVLNVITLNWLAYYYMITPYDIL